MRIAFWRRNTNSDDPLRLDIEKVVAVFQPVVDAHLINSDFEALYNTLLDEQCQLDDCIRAHRASTEH